MEPGGACHPVNHGTSLASAAATVADICLQTVVSNGLAMSSHMAALPSRLKRGLTFVETAQTSELAAGRLRRSLARAASPLTSRPRASAHHPRCHGEVGHRSSLRFSWMILLPHAAMRGRPRWYAAVSSFIMHRLDDLINCKVHGMRVPSAFLEACET